MKKNYRKVNKYLLLALLTAIFFAQSGCKKDATFSTGTPVITSVRSYAVHPGDSLLSKVGTGVWVAISGHNLKNVLNIYFDGTAAKINDVWNSDTSAIALIPAVIAFPLVPTAQLNTIHYVTTHGETTFAFSIVPPAPSISGISDEDALAGDSVTINGLSFFFVQSVTYAGLPITSYTVSNDGTAIKLAVPASITQTGTGGIVSVTTKAGKASTVYNVEDFVDGIFQNWDAFNSYPWGCNTSNTDYPYNTGWYGELYATNLGAQDFGWYNGGRGVNMGNDVQWVPVSAIDSLPSSYAVKFEIFVPTNTPWTGGSIFVAENYSWTYIARYRPWINSAGTITPFTTKGGWLTVTIPLSSFLTNNGTGTPVPSISALVGPSGNTSMNIWYINDSNSSVTSFAMGIDNIRVVRIN